MANFFTRLFTPKPDFTQFKLNTCKQPTNLDVLPALKFGGTKFTAPATVDLRDYCTKTDNQGSTPWCAAYSAANWAENILWRKNDYITEIDASTIYAAAKQLDGDPRGEGTTLTAVLQVLLNKGYFDKNTCKIVTIYGSNSASQLKYAIHKFGACLLGFNITDEWYDVCNGVDTIIGKKGQDLGGHAVLCCGYNRNGVIIQNSWGESWGEYGFALISWDAFAKQFAYGAVLTHCLDNMKMN